MVDSSLKQRSPQRNRVGRQRGPAEAKRHQPSAAAVAGGVDRLLVYVTLALVFLGTVAVYSASAPEAMDTFGNPLYYVLRQVIFYTMGLALMFGVSRIPFFYWARWAKPLALIVIGLLVYTLFKGVESYGAERWIQLPGFQFQPSELGKISVVLLLAQGMSRKPGKRVNWGMLLNLALIMVSLALILKQPSLSMTIILALVTSGMLFVAGTPLWVLLIAGGLGGAVMVQKIMSTEYQMRRIMGWLDPWKDPQDTGYNALQSFYAIVTGGMFGTGLGMSIQKLHWLPFRHTDFIFSVWAEEWGFLGCLVLLGAFGMLLYRGYVIARTCRSNFGQVLAMGITMMLAVQVIINLSVATGLFPVTGVTLPLISYGGTSVIVTLLMIGMLLSISRYRVTVSQMPQPHGL